MDKEYIIDSNILISSSRRFYPFDIMPGFWRQFLEKIDIKVVLIDKVKEEIFSENDQLSDWLRENQACFIQKNMSDIEVINAYSRIIQNVADNPRYSEAAKEEFARVADSWICAHALAHKYVVVTEETYDPNSKKRVKIPNICKDYEIEYIDMIRFFREIEVKIL